MALRFEWDPGKNTENPAKHRVSFEEATTAFSDDAALFMDDPDHSAGEDRCLFLGLSATPRVLVVSHCFRENDDVIRIISARRATRREQAQYRGRRRT